MKQPHSKTHAKTEEEYKAVQAKKAERKEGKHDRDLRIFKMFLDGATIAEMAEAADLSTHGIRAKITTQKWRDKRKEVYTKTWEETATATKKIASTILLTIKREVQKIEALSLTRQLTIEELKELRSLVALFMNEIRLDDDKPTSIASGVTRHEIILPPGVKRFGIDPPSKTVQIIAQGDVALQKANSSKDGFDIEDLND